MATLHETAYPRLKPDPTAKELAEIYTPTDAEIAFVRSITKVRGRSAYLTDRYSERVESAEELSKRVNQRSI